MDKLIISNVNKTFISNKQTIKAINSINLDIKEGEFITILGPSGCGKSTLIRCIAGFETVTEGSILVDNKQIKGPGIDRTMVFQGFEQLFPWKTVLENVLYPLRINKMGNKQSQKETAEYFLKVVGLEKFKSSYPHQLSGGMKQRVAIARALALKPKVLLMDEPFASLDAQTRTVLQKELISIWEEVKTTIIFITHNIEEAIILGDRIVVMSKQPGSIKDVVKNDLVRPRLPGNKGFSDIWNSVYGLLDYNDFDTSISSIDSGKEKEKE